MSIPIMNTYTICLLDTARFVMRQGEVAAAQLIDCSWLMTQTTSSATHYAAYSTANPSNNL
eukprot:scaffold14996_cov20-Prasinocladus_malaysianus.AAC.2